MRCERDVAPLFKNDDEVGTAESEVAEFFTFTKMTRHFDAIGNGEHYCHSAEMGIARIFEPKGTHSAPL